MSERSQSAEDFKKEPMQEVPDRPLTLNEYQEAVKETGTCLCNGGRGWCARCYGT